MSLNLIVDGEAYKGWLTANVSRSYLDFCPTFRFSFTDRWLGKPRPIYPGAECTVLYDFFVLLTGFVNVAEYRVSTSSYDLRVEGRGRTQDLVDCSAVHKTGQWRNQNLRAITRDICTPLGITHSVPMQLASTKFKRVEIEEGETGLDLLQRLGRLLGVIPITDSSGELRYAASSDIPTRVVDFPNAQVTEANFRIDDQSRFSDYLLKAQLGGDKETSGRNAALQKAAVKDAHVRRYRPLVIQSDGPGPVKQLAAEAAFQRNVRDGQHAQISYTLPGILAPDGEPWAPGMQARVRDQHFGFSRQLLVTQVDHEVRADTMQTTVQLSKPEIFSTNELPSKDKKAVL